MFTEVNFIIDVCTDCYVAAAGVGDAGETPEYAPLAHFDGQGTAVPTEEGEGHFSNHGCPGCGSPLAGQRFEVTVLN